MKDVCVVLMNGDPCTVHSVVYLYMPVVIGEITTSNSLQPPRTVSESQMSDRHIIAESAPSSRFVIMSPTGEIWWKEGTTRQLLTAVKHCSNRVASTSLDVRVMSIGISSVDLVCILYGKISILCALAWTLVKYSLV